MGDLANLSRGFLGNLGTIVLAVAALNNPRKWLLPCTGQRLATFLSHHHGSAETTGRDLSAVQRHPVMMLDVDTIARENLVFGRLVIEDHTQVPDSN